MSVITATPPDWGRLWLRYLAGVAAALLLALLLFVFVMQPPTGEIRLMAYFLSGTALISVLAGYGAYRLGWIRHAPHLSWTLLASYALSSLLTFLNVWVTARLMFASQHDLALATILLLFASGIAMSLGYFLSAALNAKIGALDRAAAAVARGDLSARVEVDGRDELAALARTFNGMAAQLERAAERQAELDRLRRDLISWVGHDLRTPLASIRAIVEALADGMVGEPDEVDRYLGNAKREIRELSSLIDDLFELAQLDAGGIPLDLATDSLNDLLSDTLESFRALAEQREVTLTGAAAPGIDPVWMDSRKIGRVLSNLLSNAIRHTPSGGRVQLTARREGDQIEVTVEDSGEGIAAADLPRIFDRFYRGEKSRSRATGGAGLGLAIAHRLVEAHGGTIRAESALEAGTRVTLTIPRGGRPSPEATRLRGAG